MKRVLLIVFICAVIGVQGYADEFEPRTALIIGNSSYETAPLRNPANDAEDMAEKLRRLEFSVTLLQNVSKGEKDVVSQKVIVIESAGEITALFQAGKRNQPESLLGEVRFTSMYGPVDINFKGVKLGTTPVRNIGVRRR